jgi:hypothetical protein
VRAYVSARGVAPVSRWRPASARRPSRVGMVRGRGRVLVRRGTRPRVERQSLFSVILAPRTPRCHTRLVGEAPGADEQVGSPISFGNANDLDESQLTIRDGGVAGTVDWRTECGRRSSRLRPPPAPRFLSTLSRRRASRNGVNVPTRARCAIATSSLMKASRRDVVRAGNRSHWQSCVKRRKAARSFNGVSLIAVSRRWRQNRCWGEERRPRGRRRILRPHEGPITAAAMYCPHGADS